MDTIISAIIGGFIGSILQPYLNQFLKSSDSKIKDLEKAYVLSDSIDSYAGQTRTFIGLLSAYQSIDKLDRRLDELKKLNVIVTPFPTLQMIMNFRLKAPTDLISKIENTNLSIMECMRPIAEGIFQPDKDEFFSQALKQSIKACITAAELRLELLSWIKMEKDNIKKATHLPYVLKSSLNFIKSNFIKLYQWANIRINK